MSVCSPRTIQGGPKDIKKESINSPRKFKFVRRPSWVHHKDVRMGQGFVRIGQDFVRVGQHFVRMGQDFVRMRQHFVRGPSWVLQKTSERCPYVVRGQDLGV